MTATIGSAAPTPRRPGRRAGARPRWEILYEAMNRLDVGELIDYAEMAALLNLNADDPQDRKTISVSARRACQVLAERAKKVARLIRGEGYEIADPDTVMVLARRHQKRAVAEVAAGRAKVETIDLTTLDPTTARLVQATVMGFNRQAEIMRQLDVRQDRLEATMNALAVTVHTTAGRVDDTRTEIAQLRAHVERLESHVQPQ